MYTYTVYECEEFPIMGKITEDICVPADAYEAYLKFMPNNKVPSIHLKKSGVEEEAIIFPPSDMCLWLEWQPSFFQEPGCRRKVIDLYVAYCNKPGKQFFISDKPQRLFEIEEYSLVSVKDMYVVAYRYQDDGDTWASGTYFEHWEVPKKKQEMLRKAVEYILQKEVFREGNGN